MSSKTVKNIAITAVAVVVGITLNELLGISDRVNQAI